MVFIYGRALQSQFVNTFGSFFMDYHVLGGFSLLTAGLIMVVLLLQRQYVRGRLDASHRRATHQVQPVCVRGGGPVGTTSLRFATLRAFW